MNQHMQAFKTAHRRLYTFMLSSLLCILLAALIWFEYQYLLPGMDWIKTFRPATLELLSGRTPYAVRTFFMPPWALLPFVPFVWLPERLGGLILTNLGILAYVYILYKIKARPAAALAFLLSPAAIVGLHSGNIDWLVMLGFVLPPPIGLFLVLIKPQVGIAVAVYWLFMGWKEGKLKKVLQTFTPVLVAYLLSFAAYGLWLLKVDNLVQGSSQRGYMDINMWPVSIPIGLVLLVMALRQRNQFFAFMASPFLSPYVGGNSYAVVILGLARYPWEAVVASAGLWIAMLLYRIYP
jgi:hypothetical protein